MAARFEWSPTDQTTGDGKWQYRFCRQDSDGSPWLAPPASTSAHPGPAASLAGAQTLPMGRQSPGRHGTIRAEFEWSRSTFGQPHFADPWAAEPYFQLGLLDYTQGGAGVQFIEFVDAAGQDRLFVRATDNTATSYTDYDARINIERAPVRMVLEARGAWVFCWYNGQLVAVVPSPDMNLNVVAIAQCLPGYAANRWMKIHQMVLRQTVPFLMRGPEKGDLHLPGLPPGGGLAASFYNEIGLRAQVSGPAIAAALPDYLLRPNLVRYGPPIQNKTLDFWGIDGNTDHPAWWPVGPPSTADISARWQGAVYLDAGSHSYGIGLQLSDRMRVWIGHTRVGEEAITQWTFLAGWASILLPGVTDRLGSPPVDGWYPIVVEWSKNPSEITGGAKPGVARLLISRSDHPDMWWNLGGSTYRLECAADSPAGFWPLDGVTHPDSSLDFPDYSGNGNDATSWITGPRGDSMATGHTAASFDGAGFFVRVPHAASINPATTITLEALVLSTDDGGIQTIVEKAGSYWFYINGGVLTALFPTTAGNLTLTGPAVPTGTWNWVVVTWNPATGAWAFYLNGSIRTTGTTVRTRTTGSADLYIGKTGAGFGFFTGHIADVSLYATSLGPARLFAHFDALSQVAVGETSPLGCFEGQVRNESHFEQLRALYEQFGVQFGVEPRTLESTGFPGQLIPQVRKGRDTNKILEPVEANQYSSRVNAEETEDALVIDGAGLGDSASQLTMESLVFSELGKHIMIHQDYESLADVTIPQNLANRLRSLLGIHSDVWEEVTATPPGFEELLPAFQLPDEIARFGWEAGDALRLRLKRSGVDDKEPRALLSVSWPFTHAGLQAPQAVFRARPRNFKEALRKIQRAALVPQRNYQGQYVLVNSELVTAPGDAHVTLPQDLSSVVKAELVVSLKVTSAVQTLSVNGADKRPVEAVGAYDVTQWVQRVAGGLPLMYASITDVGSELIFYQLLLTIRV